jgi:hypothetical protein
VALNKGIAIGNVVELDHAGRPLGKVDAAILGLLRQLAPAIVRLELLVPSHYQGWDAALVDAYAGVFQQLKELPTAPAIIAEITAQSVPGSSQEAWNDGHSEPAALGPVVTPFAGLFTTIVGEILQTLGSDGSTLRQWVNHWEIWNEPNGHNWAYGDPLSPAIPPGAHVDTNTPGSFYIYPSIYATILAGAKATIRGVQPEGKVLFGGVLCTDANAGSWPRYVQRVGELMPQHRLRCDGMGQHLYLHLQEGQQPLDQRMRTALHTMTQLQAQFDGGNEIYITESGWLGSVADSTAAAAGCVTLFTVSGETSAVAASCWFTLLDFGDYPFGIWADRNSPKPDLLAAYQQAGSQPAAGQPAGPATGGGPT